MKSTDLDRARDEMREMKRWEELIEYLRENPRDAVLRFETLPRNAQSALRLAIVAEIDRCRRALVEMGVEFPGRAVQPDPGATALSDGEL